jgi:hypothetical protein
LAGGRKSVIPCLAFLPIKEDPMLERFKRICKWLTCAKLQSKIWTAVVVALAVGWCTFWLGPKSRVTSNSDAVTTRAPEREPDIRQLLQESRISFADWQQLVKKSGSSAARKDLVDNYIGERVTWQGVVDSVSMISAENGGNPNQRYLLAMYEDVETAGSKSLGRAPALCLFADGYKDRLARLEAGQMVIVRGTLAASETLHGTLLGTRLYRCELLVQ